MRAQMLVCGLILYPVLWSGLATAACAVYARKVLSVSLGLVIRRAIRYALARATILALVIVPFAVLVSFLYQRRGQRLQDILTGDQLALVVIGGAGLTVLCLRPQLLETLDRRFFREQYDAKMILAALIDDSREAQTIDALAATLSIEIDRALHVDGVTLFTMDSDGQHLRARSAPSESSLPAGGILLALLRSSSEPMDVDLDGSEQTFQRLPEAERAWLARGRYRLVVPIKSNPTSLIGLLALGQKRSELAFSSRDRWLLSSIAGSAAVAIENIILRHSAGAVLTNTIEDMHGEPAQECQRCRVVQARTARSECAICGGALQEAPVPRTVRNFRIERRIGKGGMGVVYLAIDTNLGRTVAIKMLPGISPVEALRLRREARAMAAVAHPNVATIFAVEVWRGQPLLVVEYFDRGSLDDRIRRGSLRSEDVLAIGVHLCAGLDHMHGFGMLHRDIKPSNIAFANDGAAKLLDFGLARIAPSDSTTLDSPPLASQVTPTGILAGTPAYFSPELFSTFTPDERSDLWALALSLYEALAGQNPMTGVSLSEIVERIRIASVPDLGIRAGM